MTKDAKASILNILRIMTPFEIARMTKISTGVKKVALTDLMIMGEAAFDIVDDEAAEEAGAKEPSKNEENIIEFKKREADAIDKADKDESQSTTVFILSEKRKLYESQGKLKKKEVIYSYAQNAAVEIIKRTEEDVDLSDTDTRGTLINKKQF